MSRLKKLIRVSISKTPSNRGSIIISIAIHFVLGLAFGAMYTSQKSGEQVTEPEIVFDLVEDTLPNNNLPSSDIIGTNSHSNALENSAQSTGVPSSNNRKLIAENVPVNKRSVMLSSLASLSELRESFRFAVHRIAADSVGAFTPVHGTAPDTKVIARGLADGQSLGDRIRAGISGGGGSCAPPILK